MKSLNWKLENNNEIKLKNDVLNMCNILNIENLINEYTLQLINEFVINIIKNSDTQKRGKIKNAIIIMGIYYVTNKQFSYKDLVIKCNLNIKYITIAKKIIKELIIYNKINVPNQLKNIIMTHTESKEYLDNFINKNHINIPKEIYQEILNLIDFCEKHEILNSSPFIKSIICFCYILNPNLNNIKYLSNISKPSIINGIKKIKEFHDKISLTISS